MAENMQTKPSSVEEAKATGWIKLTPKEANDLRTARGLESSVAAVDCNNAAEGTPCGSFGDTVVCFCSNGLCACFRRP